MKNPYLAEQVEKDIIKSLLAYPERYFDFILKPKFFTHPHNVKIITLIEIKMLEKSTFSIVDLLEVKDDIVFSDLFSESFLNLLALPDYLTACRSLVGDYAKRELYKLLGDKATPEEVRDRAEGLIAEASQKSHVSITESLKEYTENYNKIRERRMLGCGVGILTGWPKFNDLVGLRHQDMLVIAARPSIGKTAFGINLALEIAALGQKVLFVSAEMGSQALLDRFFALTTKKTISGFRYARNNLEALKPQILGFGDNLNFLFGTGLTSIEISSCANKMSSVDVVIIDYLQLLNDETKKGETENNRISKISRSLKKLAIGKNCAVIALAQLNRGSEKEKREPVLSDIRDSGSIEQDADSVILLHREKREDIDMLARLAKNRNGEIGDLHFLFDLKIGNLTEAESIYLK